MKDTSVYLGDMLIHIDMIGSFVSDGRAGFMSDPKTQFAVIRAYEVLGEIAKRLPAEFREANPQINWRRLIGFRDFLAHNYEEVILEFVWNAVEDLPNLRTAVIKLIETP